MQTAVSPTRRSKMSRFARETEAEFVKELGPLTKADHAKFKRVVREAESEALNALMAASRKAGAKLISVLSGSPPRL